MAGDRREGFDGGPTRRISSSRWPRRGDGCGQRVLAPFWSPATPPTEGAARRHGATDKDKAWAPGALAPTAEIGLSGATTCPVGDTGGTDCNRR